MFNPYLPKVFSQFVTTTGQFTLSESNGLVYKPHPRFLAQNLGKKVQLIHESLRYLHYANYSYFRIDPKRTRPRKPSNSFKIVMEPFHLHLSYIPKYALLCFLNSFASQMLRLSVVRLRGSSFHNIYPSVLRRQVAMSLYKIHRGYLFVLICRRFRKHRGPPSLAAFKE